MTKNILFAYVIDIQLEFVVGALFNIMSRNRQNTFVSTPYWMWRVVHTYETNLLLPRGDWNLKGTWGKQSNCFFLFKLAAAEIAAIEDFYLQ